MIICEKLENGRVRVRTRFTKKSLCQKHFRDECDINKIMSRFEKTGEIQMRGGRPFFGDFSDGTDFLEAQNRIIEAETLFMDLPAKTRALFQNEPAIMFQFLSDPKNQEEAYRLGLAIRPETGDKERKRTETGQRYAKGDRQAEGSGEPSGDGEDNSQKKGKKKVDSGGEES